MLNTLEVKNLNLNYGISEKDFKVISYIENRLFQFLSEDRKKDQPVIASIKGESIFKLNYFLSGKLKRPVAIGVAGQTASGKSSFACDLLEAVNKRSGSTKVTKINADDYYYDRSKEVIEAGGINNFIENYDLDCPEAIELELLKSHISQLKDGHNVRTPKYMMDGTAIRYNEYFLSEVKPIIISEGLFNLSQGIRDVFDVTVFVDVSPEVQSKRWFARAKERGFEGPQAEKMFNKAFNSGNRHIKHTAEDADIIINGEASREDYKKAFESLYLIYNDIAFQTV